MDTLLAYLNRVLRAMHKISQLITKTTEKRPLLDGACTLLTEETGYDQAWMTLLDKEGHPSEPFYHAGFGPAFSVMAQDLKAGRIPPCAAKALQSAREESSSPLVIHHPRKSDLCQGGEPPCPLLDQYPKEADSPSIFCAPLSHGKRVFGWMNVLIPHQYAREQEDLHLLEELCGDLSFALHSIEIQQQRDEKSQQLRESEARWHFALEGSGDGVWDWDAVTGEVFFSRQWKAMLGYSETEISSHVREWETRIHPEDREACFAQLEKLKKGEIPLYKSEHRVLCKDGTYKWILDRGQVLSWTAEGEPLRIIGTHEDISERKQNEDALRDAVKAKDLLMQELNHRIKNNLAMISSLLSLKEQQTDLSFTDIKGQIDAIKLVHEKIQLQPQITEISLRDYLTDLVQALFTHFAPEPVHLDLNIPPLSVPVKEAVILGLLVNEIATNTVKYGLSAKEKPRFTLKGEWPDRPEARCGGDTVQGLTLELSNNGPAFPEAIDPESASSLGMRLISALTGQLGGCWQLTKAPHPLFRITL